MTRSKKSKSKRTGGKKPRENERFFLPDLNGVPIGEFQLVDGLPVFHKNGTSVIGFVKEVYQNEPTETVARHTGHNWSSRDDIRHRLDSLKKREADLLDEVQVILQTSMASIHLTRNMQQQKNSVTSLVCGVEIAHSQKIAARTAGDRDQCDYWFGLQCILHATAHIVEVWIDLKSERPDRAWIHKIDAEDYLKISRVAIVTSGIPADETLDTLSLLVAIVRGMDFVFPPLMFGSPGYSYSSASCSVCKCDISKCEHIEGYVYSGKYCTAMSLRDMQPDHFARVQSPRDRRSYFITSIGDDGSCYHVMTGRKIGRKQTVTAGLHGRLTLLPDIAT